MTPWGEGILAYQLRKGFLDNPYVDFSTLTIPKEYSIAARRWIDGYVWALTQGVMHFE